MASGTADAPPYRGRLGATRKEILHVSCRCGAILAAEVYRSVDAEASPKLAARLASPEAPAFDEVSCPHCARATPVHVPVVYHDPDARQFALVIPEAMRHRELEERARLLDDLAADREAEIPSYVRRPAVVFGAAGLADWLGAQREAAADEGPSEKLAAREQAVAEREQTLEARERALDDREGELAERERAAEEQGRLLRARERALVEREADLAQREKAAGGEGGRHPEPLFAEETTEKLSAAQLAAADEPADIFDDIPSAVSGSDDDDFGHATIADMPASLLAGARGDPVTEGLGGTAEPSDEIADDMLDSGELIVDDEDAVTKPLPGQGGETVVGGRHDVALERWMVSGDDVLKRVDDGGMVHLAAAAEGDALSELLADDLQLRVLLHRLPTYPVVTIAVGSAAAMDGAGGDPEPYAFLFDVRDSDDAAVLDVLGRRFHLELSVCSRDYEPLKKRTVTAGLAENVRYAVSTARDELGRIDPAERSFTRAVIAFSDPGYDRYGRQHPQRRAFRDEDLGDLDSLPGVLRAVATARHFSRPEHEDYLLLLRGYPLKLWYEQRRRVIRRAIECGIWMGPSLARMAVRDGMVRSRKQLISELQRGFTAVTRDPDVALDDDTIRENWEALRREASALGLAGGDVLTSAPRAASISSSKQPLVSGTISNSASGAPSRRRPAAPTPGRARPEELDTAELVALLEDDEGRRLPAALELARRRETGAVGAVFASLLRMTRKEAVEVMGAAVTFGPAAVPYLVEGMSARKAFLRQGCALALGMLGTEEAVEALSDAVVTEPTDIWTEIARAIGEVGPPAVMSVVSRLRGRSEDARPRVAWALAHIAGRGGRQPVQTLAQGRDPVAAEVARSALELVDRAQGDDAAVRGEATPRDQTVNRAFSRKFFQAASAASAALATSTLPLDERDLLEARDVSDV